MKMKAKLLSNWHLTRIVQVIVGLMILWAGIDGGAWWLAALGVLLSLKAVFNQGCCGSGNCNISKNQGFAKDDIEQKNT